jgi:DNA-binding transcriptional LysR family regulator
MPIEADLDLPALRAFQAVATSGSMSAASRELGLTQSAISQRISAIEKRIGVELFDRNMRPLALTPAGQLLRQRADQLLFDAREITIAARLVARQPTITLRIGIPESMAILFAPPLSVATGKLPATSVITTRTRNVEAFLARELDVVITPDPMLEADGIERFPLVGNENYVLLSPKGKKSAGMTVRTLAESELPFLGYISPSFTARVIGNHLRRLRLHPERHQQVDLMSVMIELVGQGVGWTIASPISFVAAGAPKNVEVSQLMPVLTRSLSLIARRREFGDIPRDLAAVCRTTIRNRVAPVVAKRMSWLPSVFH